MPEATLQEILSAREARAARRAALLRETRAPVVTFTMNIAGSVKLDRAVAAAFAEGLLRLTDALAGKGWAVLRREERREAAGCAALLAVDAPAAALKGLCCVIEESAPLCRLFDLDVHTAQGETLSRTALGYAPRRCLLCGGDAHACARSRAHSVPELFERTHALIRDYFAEKRRRAIAQAAQRALLYEVCVTPKPGLVDREGSGAHRDMDIFSFMASAAALGGYFYDCAALGEEALSPAALLDRLRCRGLAAQAEMLRAARANTHKGAIFSLGLLCAASAAALRDDPAASPREAARRAAALGALALQELPGGRNAARGGAGGARAEAASGFASVFDIGLPALEDALAAGYDLNDAGALALLALIARVADSNPLCRAGAHAAQAAREAAAALLSGAAPPDMDAIRALGARFIADNLSPGGCADLLAICFYFHFFPAGTAD